MSSSVVSLKQVNCPVPRKQGDWTQVYRLGYIPFRNMHANADLRHKSSKSSSLSQGQGATQAKDASVGPSIHQRGKVESQQGGPSSSSLDLLLSVCSDAPRVNLATKVCLS